MIVTTPHTLSVKDAVKGINMFKKVDVPILGLVNNMALFTCPCCHTAHPVFGSGDGVRAACADHGVPLLGEVPLHQAIGAHGQEGRPTVVAEPEGERARVFLQIADKVGQSIGL